MAASKKRRTRRIRLLQQNNTGAPSGVDGGGALDPLAIKDRAGNGIKDRAGNNIFLRSAPLDGGPEFSFSSAINSQYLGAI